MELKFTINDYLVFIKLFRLKHFTPDTLKGIAVQIDGNGKWKSETYNMLIKLVKISCLTYHSEKTILGKTYPTYTRDKKKMLELWKSSIYYKFSEEIIYDERIVF